MAMNTFLYYKLAMSQWGKGWKAKLKCVCLGEKLIRDGLVTVLMRFGIPWKQI